MSVKAQLGGKSGDRTAAPRRAKWRPPGLVTIFQYGVLIVLLCLTFLLVLLMLSMSLRPTVLIYTDFWGLPWPPTFANYQKALLELLPAMGRTLWVSVLSIAGILLFSSTAAYAFARMQFPGKYLLFYAVVVVLMVPGIILLTPHFILANQLRLRGSLWGLAVYYVAGGLPFGIFLITTFFQTQPSEIFEAARLDGASEVQSLVWIAIPLAIPILVTVGMFNFLGIYGDYIWPSLMLTEDQQTLLVSLTTYDPQVDRFSSRPDIGAQTAGYTFATIPQLVLFAFGMKYFIQGVTSGSIKG